MGVSFSTPLKQQRDFRKEFLIGSYRAALVLLQDLFFVFDLIIPSKILVHFKGTQSN